MAFERSYADRGDDDSASLNPDPFPPQSARPRPRKSLHTYDPDSESLLAQLLPEPSAHRAQSRTIATGICILFFVFIIFKVSTTSNAVGEGGGYQEWMREGYFVEIDRSGGRTKSSSTLGGGKYDEMGINEDRVPATTTTPADGEGGLIQSEVTNSSSTKVEGFDRETTVRKSEEINDLIRLSVLSEYLFHKVVPVADDKRIIILGDIHGSIVQLKSLLSRLSYSPTTDALFHVGDLVSKSNVSESLAVVQYMRESGIKGVRGNHDQGVLEWRNWFEAMGPLIAANEATPLPTSASVDLSATLLSANSSTMKLLGELEATKLKEEGNNASGSTDLAEEGGADAIEGAGSTDELLQTSESELTDSGERRRRTKRWMIGTRQDDIDEVVVEEVVVEVDVIETDKDQEEVDITTVESPATTPSSSPPSGNPPVSNFDWLLLKESELSAMGISVPPGWEWGGNWFELARQMPQEDIEYLRELPHTIWVDMGDGTGTFIVHAGMLPWFTRPTTATSTDALPTESSFVSELASSPLYAEYKPPPAFSSILSSSTPLSLLLVPENREPFTLLNMRTVKKIEKENGDVEKDGDAAGIDSSAWKVSKNGRMGGSKGKKGGIPWTQVWESRMRGEDGKGVNVVYGHWASRGLNVEANSFGLDTGCAYGRRLSSLVLSPSSSDSESPLSTVAPRSSRILPPFSKRQALRPLPKIMKEKANEVADDKEEKAEEEVLKVEEGGKKDDLFQEKSVTFSTTGGSQEERQKAERKSWVVSRSCRDRPSV